MNVNSYCKCVNFVPLVKKLPANISLLLFLGKNGSINYYLAIKSPVELCAVMSTRYNRNQVRVDQASIVGSLGGAGVAVLLGSSAVSGAVVGLVGGTVAMGMYNTVCAEKQ